MWSCNTSSISLPYIYSDSIKLDPQIINNISDNRMKPNSSSRYRLERHARMPTSCIQVCVTSITRDEIFDVTSLPINIVHLKIYVGVRHAHWQHNIRPSTHSPRIQKHWEKKKKWLSLELELVLLAANGLPRWQAYGFSVAVA